MSALTSSLVRDGVVPVRKIEEALQRQVISGGDVETVLLEMEAVPENVLAGYRAALYDLPPAARHEVMEAAPEVLQLVPAEVANEHRFVPLRVDGRSLHVVRREPLSAEQEERIGFLLGFSLVTHIACEVRLAAALARHYGGTLTPRFVRLIDRLERTDAGELPRVSRASIPSLAAHGSDIPYKTKAKSDPGLHFESRTQPLGLLLEDEQRKRRTTARGLGVVGEKARAPSPPPEPIEAPEREPSVPPLRRLRGPLTIPAGERLLKRAGDRDHILGVFFSFAQQFFDYTALFVVTDEVADGREAWGIGASTAEVRDVTIPLDAPSVFAEARRTLAPLVKTLDATEVDRDVAAMLRRANTPVALILPIAIRQRVVLLLYGDRDGEEFDLGAVMELVRFSSRVVEAFEQLILRKKRGYHSEAPPPETDRRSLKQAARSIAETAGSARPDPERRRRDSGSWHAGRRSSPGFAPSTERSVAHEGDGDSWTSVAHAEQPASIPPAPKRPAQPPPPPASETDVTTPRMPAVAPMPQLEPPASERAVTVRDMPAITMKDLPALPPDAPPSAVLGIPRDAPPPPAAELDLDAPEYSLVLDGTKADEDEPEMTLDDEYEVSEEHLSDDELDDDDLDLSVDDDEPAPREEARRPSNRPRPQGTYRVKGGPIDVIRGGAADGASARTSARPRARPPRDPRREEEDEGAQRTERVRLPPEPSDETRSVIVDMGEQVHAQVSDLLAARTPAAQSALIHGLIHLGEPALPALVQAFPGPLRFDRHVSNGKPPPGRDISVIARALVAFGERAVPYVASLLSSGNADVRYYAALVASELIHPELIDAISERIYDEDPEVRRIACALLPRLAGHRGFDEIRVVIRRVARLRGKDPSRRWQAVDALAALRDVEMIDRLVDLLKEDDAQVVEHAHRALVILTCVDQGPSHKRWRAWYEKNKKRHRIEWLIEGLLNGEESIRRIAGEELRRLTQEHYGFHAGAPKKDRERVQKLFKQWWEEEGRRRFAEA